MKSEVQMDGEAEEEEGGGITGWKEWEKRNKWKEQMQVKERERGEEKGRV